MSHLDQWRDKLAELFPSTDIEEPFDIGAAVFRAYEQGQIGPLTIRLRGTSESPRRYLGASSLGNECMRKTWAQWRGLTNGFEGRIVRLFRTGDVYEERMRHELESLGFTAYGDQSRFEAFGGRVAGHDDGFLTIAGLPPALWEAKTANHSRTLKLDKLRRDLRHDSEALKQWDRKYWAQTHTYMAAFGVDVCLFEVTDKDTDSIVCLLFEVDPEAVADTGRRAKTILESVGPPPRGYKRAVTPGCTRYCDAVEWCWHGAPMPVACGSCRFWLDGLCTTTGEPALKTCEQYAALPQDNETAFSEWETL